MPTRPHLAVLAAAACLATLAGCGQSGDATGASPTDTTPAPTITTAPPPSTTSPPPTSTGTAAGAPGVPEPARQHTKAGAIAFANYYTDKVNALGLAPRKGVLEPLSLKGCKTCQNMIETITHNVDNNRRLDGNQAIIIRSYSPYASTQSPHVWVVTRSPEVHILAADGGVYKTFRSRPAVGMVFELVWTTNGWRVGEVKVDKSATK